MDGLAIDEMDPLRGSLPALDRKEGAILIDQRIAALTQPYPWADPASNLLVNPAVLGNDPTFTAPKNVNASGDKFLKTQEDYAQGDFRGDVAGKTRAQTCILASARRCSSNLSLACAANGDCPFGGICLRDQCSLGWQACTMDAQCPTLDGTAAGAEPRGWDGYVDEKDIDYCCSFVRGGYSDWSNINQAVRSDLSCDMNGDLEVDSADIDELVVRILKTKYGDVDLDGDVDGVDLNIISMNQGMTSGAGWGDGDLNCDGAVNGEDTILVGGLGDCDACQLYADMVNQATPAPFGPGANCIVDGAEISKLLTGYAAGSGACADPDLADTELIYLAACPIPCNVDADCPLNEEGGPSVCTTINAGQITESKQCCGVVEASDLGAVLDAYGYNFVCPSKCVSGACLFSTDADPNFECCKDRDFFPNGMSEGDCIAQGGTWRGVGTFCSSFSICDPGGTSACNYCTSP